MKHFSIVPLRRFSLWLMLIMSAWTYAQATWASDSNSINDLLRVSLEDLLDYEVSAPTKSQTRLRDTPGAVSVITYDQIRNSTARTIPELLRTIPGVNVRWNPMVQTIDIRSFGSNPFTSKVLLLIDGIPYNSWNKGGFPQHPGFDFFNLENVKHIEIIRGSGSALYGENALNGVINIVTLSAHEYRQARISYYQNDGHSRTLNTSYGKQFDDNRSLFLSARSEESRLPMEFWEEQEADASGQDVFIKARIQDWQVSYYRRQDQFDGYDENIIPPNFNFTSVDKIRQDINIFHTQYSHLSDNNHWALQGNLSYSDRNGTSCGGCHAASQSEVFSKKIDHGHQLFSNVQLELLNIENHKVLVGAEFRELSGGDSFDQVSGAHDATQVTEYRKGALFAQDKISITDKNIDIILGGRYDTKTSPDLFDDYFSPRIALVAKPSDKLTLRSSWNRATRYPSFTELYQDIIFFSAVNGVGVNAIPPTNFKPNPNLEPEKIDSYEIGGEYNFSPKLRSKVDFFYNEVSDPIIVTYSLSDIGFENHPNDAISYGMEWELSYEPHTQLSSFINWSYQKNRQRGNGTDSQGKPIEFTYSPENKINAGLTFRPEDRCTITFDVTWRDSYKAPSFWNEINGGGTDEAELASYAYLNLRTQYRFPIKTNSNDHPLTVSFAIKNMTDETPYETLTGVSAQRLGREYVIGFEYDFAN